MGEGQRSTMIDQYTGRRECMSDKAFLELFRVKCREHGIPMDDPADEGTTYSFRARKRMSDEEVEERLRAIKVPVEEMKR